MSMGACGGVRCVLALQESKTAPVLGALGESTALGGHVECKPLPRLTATVEDCGGVAA